MIQKRWTQFLGLLGIVALIFALICQLILEDDKYNLIVIHYVVAVACLLTFFISGGLAGLSYHNLRNKTLRSLQLTIYSLVFISLIIAINYLAATRDIFFYDSTEQKVFSLAPQTQEVLQDLPAEVTIYAFFLAGLVEPAQLNNLLNRIAKESDLVNVKVVDPEREPLLAERLAIKESGTLHFQMQYADKLQEVQLDRNIDEQAIVDALLKLSRANEKRVAYITGHGEPSIHDIDSKIGYGFLAEAIQAENIALEELVLGQLGAVPDAIDALILAAPHRPLLVSEREILENYLLNGGKAMLLHESNVTQDVRELASKFDINVGQDAVIEVITTAFTGPQYGLDVMVTSYGPHRITNNFDKGTLFSIVSSVRRAETAAAGTVAELAFSSASSWAETSLDDLFNDRPVGLDENDIHGPVSLAAAYENVTSQTRLVVFGDAAFVTNAYIKQLYNRDFFLNSLNWVLGEDSGITIRARTMRDSKKLISANQFSLMFLVSGILIPELILITGLAIWWRRRSE